MPRLLVTLLASLVVAACGGSNGPGDPGTPPAATATVSGVVKDASGGAIEGATVKVGTLSVTTGAGGRFELPNVPVGGATIVASAPRFDPRSDTVTLAAGANVHDLVLTPQALFSYQTAVAYLPPGVARYRAAIVFLPGLRDGPTGNPLDSRRVVTGAPGTLPCPIWCTTAELAEVKQRALQLAGGEVALVGTTTLLDQPADYERLLQALAQFGTQSAHPELADVPILFVGHSQGGCTAYGFTRAHAARVAGFVTMKGGCHALGPAQGAAAVPAFFLVGRLDDAHRVANITPVFEAGRAAGAPWSLSTDAFGHGPILDLDLMFDWIAAVLAARLPATPGAPLRAMTETAGWLGDRSSGAIATHACYGAARASASWLPSREAAIGWQRMAGGTAVVSAC
ncbi:carboxypeptidase-like regulatory domain-containing protein [Roseisolibacter sp. H3M3-2]|uniref:carboxypeptidase-like regulatory domain-containing protein n=1 Tax=Roseisolibacter sp. H3M3-2 TaxID=3031323 RepID=UPI0023DCBB33|nr:carboxypeptidase-like regulatory domain-containing protein [Roseisolibacter sp. H3M3-2]MDF1503454.1 carboxypeptidase-like regulatory domain-containing protein [Roseisolibacter sp. H3M3-2]